MEFKRLAALIVCAGLAQHPANAQDSDSQARQPMPATNPGDWVSSDDYPAWALRSDVEGVVRFTLTVDTEGRITGCDVTGSSGVPDLDKLACDKVTERGAFIPALDDDGRPVAGTWSSAVRWVIPENRVQAVPSPMRIVIYTIVEPDGSISDCNAEGIDDSATVEAICARTSRFQPPVDADGNRRRVKLVMTQAITVEDLPIQP
ncbi:energy transducer TonB [Leptolyngbya sp. 15MV]|nr:energy transducer TonB [Leptolyngbya sp. 15MV]